MYKRQVITVKESNGEEGIIIDVFRNGELLDSKTIWYNEYVKCQTCEECLTEYEKERYGNYCSKCAKTDDW